MLKKFLRNFSLYNDISLFIFKNSWRRVNKENFTIAKNRFDVKKVSVGKYTYGDLNIKSFGNKEEKLIIGNFCSIAPEVTFLLSGEHDYKTISTYPFKKKFLNIDESKCKGNIIVEDDVWIGYGATILSGVRIGKGSVIAAKAIVTKDVPPYTIFINNQVKKYRFSQDIINELLKLDYGTFDKEFILNNLELLYQKCDKNIIEKLELLAKE